MAQNLRALPALAAGINDRHDQAHRSTQQAIDAARECGELLLEAKAQVEHGSWLPWLEANTRVGARQAQKYMRLARADKCELGSHLGINAALEALAEPKGDALAKEHGLAELRRCWAEVSPAAKEAFLLVIEMVGTGQDIPDYLTLADLGTLRGLHATAEAASALKLRRPAGKTIRQLVEGAA
jgi:hypothetical protein